MSETEINEDNCVLSEENLDGIDDMFSYWKRNVGIGDTSETTIYIDKLFQKINKLNEMAKEKQNERG